MNEVPPLDTELKKVCKNCGAALHYKPGTTSITCAYCGHEEAIETTASIHELELQAYLQKMGAQSYSESISMLQCRNCGANQHVEEHYKSLHCVYCGEVLITEDLHQEEWILPGAVLPFQIDPKRSYAIFKQWVDGLWFAPNKLKKAALDPELTKGLYLPYWTFDAQLTADYQGQRGDHYYVTKTYRDSKGKTRTRQERRTRWSSAAGRVAGFVDDTVIAASVKSTGRIPAAVARWNLTKLQPFSSKFLAGFVTEKYTLPLQDGHLQAQQEMKAIAERWARKDIGGDEQRVSQLDLQLEEETFKHVLLPVYISTYRYRGKHYNFYINGENGMIKGKRPYSFWKIFFTIVGGLLLLFLLSYLFG
ncbi:zinc finger domain-containing protein [Croceiramulus getboli]|nr:DNA helicase PriA [Flavobacteriaceae bacterium YJPT1-3]